MELLQKQLDSSQKWIEVSLERHQRQIAQYERSEERLEEIWEAESAAREAAESQLRETKDLLRCIVNQLPTEVLNSLIVPSSLFDFVLSDASLCSMMRDLFAHESGALDGSEPGA